MIRRYIATSLIVFFFAYAAYLIVTDGGTSSSTITFVKLNNNIQNRFLVLTGQKVAEPTAYEKEKQKELDALKANAAGKAGDTGSVAPASTPAGTTAGSAAGSNPGNPAVETAPPPPA